MIWPDFDGLLLFRRRREMAENICVGILGAGFMGGMHARNLLKHEGVSVSGICSRSLESAEKLAGDLDGADVRCFDDFDKMMDAVSLDALVVSLPPFAHCGQVEKAARKGLHLFLEKPLAIDMERAGSMVEAIEGAGVKSMMGFHMRYGGALKKLKSLIDDGTAGRPTLYDARYECRMDAGTWWARKDGSGGQILEQVIHLYDMSRFLMGEAHAVSGLAANLCHEGVDAYSIEDTSLGSVQFKSGAMATIAGSNCGVQWEWNNPFTVICENLTVRFTDANTAEFIYTGGEETKRELVEDSVDMYAAEIDDFVHLLRGEPVSVADVREGLIDLEMTCGVLESASKGGAPIKLKS